MRVLYTCHEGCDPRVWKQCGQRIQNFATDNGATLIELPKSMLRNPQWVLFDAMRHSVSQVADGDFAWIDSDVVVMKGATDIWSLYTDDLTVCPNNTVLSQELLSELNLPSTTINICTGVVRWNQETARRILAWFDANVGKLPKIKVNRMGDIGDQEVLLMALHATGHRFSFFHPSMHVAGPNPPINSAFKHKGGAFKLNFIPKFIKMNEALESRVDPYSTHSEVLAHYANGVAVEFGCGLYSTPILLDQCESVLSVEMQDAKWLDKVYDSFGKERKNWSVVTALGAWDFLGVKYPDNIDTAFVDGHRSSRFACVNFMMRLGARVIIAHDTERPGYGWGKIVSVGYTETIYKTLTPWTTVWVRNDIAIDRLPVRKS